MVECPVKSIITTMTHRYVIPLIKKKKKKDRKSNINELFSSVV